MKKKILAVLLAALMLSSYGCGNADAGTEGGDTVSADTTAAVEETEETLDPAEADDLPTDCKDYEGTEFVVMYRDRTGESVTWQTWDVYTEELNGERINDAVFEIKQPMVETV